LEVSALATALTVIALAVTAFLVIAQLRRQVEDQFVSGTAGLFAIWVDDDFQRAVQWVLYELSEETWRDFVRTHHGGYGQRALTRVGGYFNRVGYLVIHRMLGGQDLILLDTLAGPAIEVWQKIEPLVLEARLVENSTMFQDFQQMLPRCHECYVPTKPVPPRVREVATEAGRLQDDL
jgi:hypothetical protein